MDRDATLAFDIMSILLSADCPYSFFTVLDGPPPSKMRPRFNRKTGNAFVPAVDRENHKRTRAHLKAIVESDGEFFTQPGVPFLGNVALGCVFFRPSRQRIDVDNMVKHVADAATGVLWADDSQVTTVYARVELDADRPRSIIIAGDTESTMPRGDALGAPCDACGTWVVGKVNGKPKTCGAPVCVAAVQGRRSLETPVPCETCQRKFVRGTSAQRFCSTDCAHESFKAKHKQRAAPRSRCADCDKQLGHLRGGRCRDCWRRFVRAQREARSS